MPRLGGRGPMIIVVVIVLVAVVGTWALLRDGGTQAPPSLSPSSSVTTSTLQHLCSDVAPDMPLRVDSVKRTEAAVRADARTLKAEGNVQAANAAKDLADALASLATALDTQGDTQAANAAVQDALGTLPC